MKNNCNKVAWGVREVYNGRSMTEKDAKGRKKP
jgi:hypothetical protein